jgi:AcrR family transcriptional regulator
VRPAEEVLVAGRQQGGRRPGAGRPRLDADGAILSAARGLLRSAGFHQLNIEEVARRAKVSPGTVYRRWGSKTELAVAAYAETIGSAEPVDTGLLRRDLEAVVPDLYRFFTGEHGQLLVSLLGAVGVDEAVNDAIRQATRSRRAGLVRILERARARGEIAPDIDIELAIDLMLGALWTRLLVTREPITRPLVRRTVHLAAKALTG